ncbi:hypothetical protein Pcinc_031958 [Petrolisthes cinctipes]|uniref:Uncharacterized protein n=1 Tax=Petrolisthes cinctipes TaxID=88211 RepID=A0AAE1EVI7_PETCI|nr:hypothetical protein Pcinc_038024 [Petrolisthes cinctipes]KAK3862151.1 hypothetical protein Pcinc_031958 [Petrolisthes cinctipes]
MLSQLLNPGGVIKSRKGDKAMEGGWGGEEAAVCQGELRPPQPAPAIVPTRPPGPWGRKGVERQRKGLMRWTKQMSVNMIAISINHSISNEEGSE